jgi:PII-like signaling protein
MLPSGSAKKVTIYLNEDTRSHIEPLWSTILGFLRHHHVSGATIFRADLSFGSHEQYHDPRSEYIGEHRAIRLEFVETAEHVDQLLPTLYEMVTDGLLTVQDLTVVKSVSKDRPKGTPEPHAVRKYITTKAKLLRIYLGESDKHQEEPLYEAIVKRFHMEQCSGATVYRGILGYGAKGHTRKGGRFHFSHDLPIMISVVETADKVDHLIQLVSGMLQDGIIVTSDVELHQIVHALPTTGDSK